MDTLSYKTVHLNAQTVNKEWVLVDAAGQTLGRLASRVAYVLRGKHKPGYTPHVDCGDNVIVINADKVVLTGNKFHQKMYYHYTGYPHGQRGESAENIIKRKPTFLVEHAVKGMLPKNRLGRQIFKNLHVYAGAEHPHQAQTPKVIDINKIK
ncbi:MAG TPA: 50S ribosomal protein L13 [Bacteroidales bacterium]|nr:50S ribosomal protein L13 [Bacteroidales bacterium]HON97118.1 50S ribosomal protein L13 [Bacteroidales bacterium]